ncbi:LuxR C-terminal-related transcriptional regulator [Candidatus Latescibacterota bacterium]
MSGKEKTKAELKAELKELRKHFADVKKSEKDRTFSDIKQIWESKNQNVLTFFETIRNIINALPYFVIIIDEDHNILLANDSAQKLIGKNNEDLLGCYCPKTVHGLDDPYPGCPLVEAIEKDKYVEKDLLDPLYSSWVSTGIYPTQFKTHQGKRIYLHLVRDITTRKLAEENLIKAQDDLGQKTINLEETNIAMKILLEHQGKDKQNTEKNILENIKTLVFPYIEKLEHSSLNERQATLLKIIETNLSETVKPFVSKFKNIADNFSPTEIRVAKMVKEGKTAKEIGEIMCISPNTVKEHNSHIRKKLGIKRKKVNLRTYLQSFLSD